MALLHDNVFDAALNHIKNNGTEAEVQNASGTALVDAITLDTNNYGSPVNGSPSGRQIEVLTNDSSDMKNISVDTAGSATKIAIKDASGNVLVVASIASAPISLGAADQVSLGTFNVVLKDPT